LLVRGWFHFERALLAFRSLHRAPSRAGCNIESVSRCACAASLSLLSQSVRGCIPTLHLLPCRAVLGTRLFLKLHHPRGREGESGANARCKMDTRQTKIHKKQRQDNNLLESGFESTAAFDNGTDVYLPVLRTLKHAPYSCRNTAAEGQDHISCRIGDWGIESRRGRQTCSVVFHLIQYQRRSCKERTQERRSTKGAKEFMRSGYQ
jgi:hypothetical protein